MKTQRQWDNRKIKIIIIVLLSAFLVYNLVWYFGEYKVYIDLQKEFPEIEDSGVKIYVDEDNFQYSVSTPDYLLWNGNLAIAEENVQYALIIWLQPFKHESKQGILFNGYKGLNTQIMIKSQDKAEDLTDQSIILENQDLISKLFEKANYVWGLRLK